MPETSAIYDTSLWLSRLLPLLSDDLETKCCGWILPVEYIDISIVAMALLRAIATIEMSIYSIVYHCTKRESVIFVFAQIQVIQAFCYLSYSFDKL